MITLRPERVETGLRLLCPLGGGVPACVPGFLFRLHALRLLPEPLRLAPKAVQFGRGSGARHRRVPAARNSKGYRD